MPALALTHLEQLGDLILDEGQQGGHDERDPFAQARRELIAKGFPAARRHEDEAVMPAEGRADHL